MLDRKIVPEFEALKEFKIHKPKEHVLKNGLKIIYVDEGDQELVRLEFWFRAGSAQQDQVLQAQATNALLKEGTTNRTSLQLAEDIDQYGAFLEVDCSKDYASVILYTLNKHLPKLLPILKDVLLYPSFDQTELDLFIQNGKQKWLVNNEKVDVVARRLFNETLFGKDHPYGRSASLEDYDELSVEILKSFFKKYYSLANCEILVAGWCKEDVLNLLQQEFGSLNLGQTPTLKENFIPSANVGNNYLEKKNALQSALRIGRLIVNRSHEDFCSLMVLNTILGGYFGSRLMTNIREDKGYTYGIGSAIASLKEQSYFFISTEVGTEVTKDALNEIYKEILKLQEEPLSKEELELVRNYISASFLRKFDGPFAILDRYKELQINGLDYSYYERYFRRIQDITSEELILLAQKYFKKEDLLEVVVGMQ